MQIKLNKLLSHAALGVLFCLSDVMAIDNVMVNEFDQEFNNSHNIVKDINGSNDPLKGYNEVMTTVNDTIYTYVFMPVQKGYVYVLPETPRNCISNFFDNLFFPIRFANNILQFKFHNAMEETERFVVNTTLGFGGIIDIAQNDLNISKHKEDFGQTLGHYGFPSGIHIVLPIFGPSNVRDVVGLSVDLVSNPINYIDMTSEQKYVANGLNFVNELPSQMKIYNAIKVDAIELYPTLKNAYESSRENSIKQ